MTVDQSQWDHSPGGFPETLGHTNYAYSNNTAIQGYESTLNSKQNSLDYPRDDGFSHISFLYANEKRFGDFHSLFRSVPDDEKLIEDYGCALQKEILVQGRLYISENHVCFHANIFGWVTTLVIAFSEITAIEKRLTAFVIPNAISIVTTTNTKGHFFASFLSRDAAHDLLMAAWRKSFPCAANASSIPAPALVIPTLTSTSISPSFSYQQQDQQQHQAQPASNRGVAHSPTTCKCSKDNRHYANTYMSDTFPGSLESIWKLLFDSHFSKGFLTSDVMKGADVQEETWQNASDGTATRVTRYTRWLGMPIGPKTTKAIVTDVCEHKDFDDYVTVVTTTSTPDVPSGGSFTTKVRTCLTWAGPHQVLVVVTGAVEFTKSSWIKGQIEKGAAEGLTFHYKEVNPCMRKHI
ncbi:MAG: GRAM domain-containing protein, partial [Linnemannia elongata]